MKVTIKKIAEESVIKMDKTLCYETLKLIKTTEKLNRWIKGK